MTWDNGIISHTIKKQACVQSLIAGSKSLKNEYKWRCPFVKRQIKKLQRVSCDTYASNNEYKTGNIHRT
jgi:hypothetical protein